MKCYLLDRHPGTARGMLSFLREQGIEVIDRCFPWHWWLYYTKQPNKEWRELHWDYNAAVYAPWVDKVAEEEARYKPDFFFCSMPPSLFTLFEKCNAPAICNMANRLDYGQLRAEIFDALIEKAVAGVESGKLRMYSMSCYDSAYFKYFTGKDAPYFPAPVNYLRGGVQWQLERATRSDILLWHGKAFAPDSVFIDEYLLWFDANSDIKLTANPIFPSRNIYRKIAERPIIAKTLRGLITDFRPANIRHPLAQLRDYGYKIMRMRRVLKMYSYQDLLRFKAIVVFPYTVFSVAMLELLELGVPAFYPSKRLLKHWDERYGMMFHRTSKHGQRSAGGFSNIAYGADSAPDPNDSVNHEALHYWLDKSEFYNWDVRYFDSPADLHEQLKAADFEAMHRDVLKTRARMDKIRDARWAEIRRDLTKTNSTGV